MSTKERTGHYSAKFEDDASSASESIAFLLASKPSKPAGKESGAAAKSSSPASKNPTSTSKISLPANKSSTPASKMYQTSLTNSSIFASAPMEIPKGGTVVPAKANVAGMLATSSRQVQNDSTSQVDLATKKKVCPAARATVMGESSAKGTAAESPTAGKSPRKIATSESPASKSAQHLSSAKG